MRGLALTVVASVSLAIAAATPRSGSPKQLPGWVLYDRLCVACHGAAGDGRGPAAPYTWGRPRDFTQGVFAFRSTAVGQLPTADDLRAAITNGVPGTSMPGFRELTPQQVDQLLEVVNRFGPPPRTAKPITLGTPPASNPERGAQLWSQHGCTSCHGAGGRGDVNVPHPPFDLTALPLRRPRASDDAATRRHAAALSIATGLAGTPMPGFAKTIPDADIWALADHVVALGSSAARTDRSSLDRTEIDADRSAKLAVGSWPGNNADEAPLFGAPITEQGPPLPQLAPAQASLRQQQCARCHAKQSREWRTSVHARASVWGLPARELDHAADGDASCARCHTPLAEQQTSSSAFDAALRDEGVTCAGCHVRGWVRRGPPRRAPTLLPAAGYPLVELEIYERSDFCMSCHQLPPRTAVNGKPLLNTYKEWLEGPYMRRGIQCQHCHMPNREHTWLGIHDKETVRQGMKLDARAYRKSGEVFVAATLANVGAGHYLPTTPTPALFVRLELLDAKGTAIQGARAELRIGRDVESTADGWKEHADTRIPPGDVRVMTRGWKAGRTKDASTARVTVEVAPDDYYERLYGKRLASSLPAATRTAYEGALARARGSHYIAEQRSVVIAVESTR